MVVTATKFWSEGKTNPFIKRRMAGIYAIRNLINHKVYVGSAVSIYDRLYNHIWHLESGTHHNPKLLSAWRKYGLAAFSLEVLEIMHDLTLLLGREQVWIKRLESIKHGYNISPNAGSNLGRVFGITARKAMADAATKAMADPIIKARHRTATIAAMRNPEVKKKCSEALKKRWQDPTARLLMISARHNVEIRGKAILKFRETILKRDLLQPLVKSAFRARAYRVTRSDGRINSIHNLKRFCLEHSISYSSAMHVLHGRMRHINGYVFERAVRTVYQVTHPDSRIVLIHNLKQFCSEHSISYNSAIAVLNGKLRQAKGYVFERTNEWL